MRVICTGISGTERVGALDEVARLAAGIGRPLALFDVREAMFQIAEDVGEPVEEETILDMSPRALVLLRAAALEQIFSLGGPSERGGDWIVNTHAVFRWKNSLISGFDPYYLRRLKPDLYVTVTDGVLAVRDRLCRHPRWEDTTAEDVLVWREEEQWATEEMARIHRKPQYLVPRATLPQTLFRLMFQPKVRTAYLSYPMQHVQPGAERALAAFKQRLEERLVVFDPADVDDLRAEGAGNGSTAAAQHAISTGDADAEGGAFEAEAGLSARERRHIADQIVFRDYKLIAQSDMVVVFYDALVPSPGVISEMNYALHTGKRVYGVWLPDTDPSPFFTRYCTKWFTSVDALFRHFDRYAIAGRSGTAERVAP